MVGGQALPNAVVYIQATSDLLDGFSTIGTTTADGTGAYQYDDATATQTRFYRATYP
jgi:hypothetical protein